MGARWIQQQIYALRTYAPWVRMRPMGQPALCIYISSPRLYPPGPPFQSEFGDIYKVTLAYNNELVTEVKIKYFDTIPVCVSICVLKTGFLFAASEAGNHALYQFVVGGVEREAAGRDSAVLVMRSGGGVGCCPTSARWPMGQANGAKPRAWLLSSAMLCPYEYPPSFITLQDRGSCPAPPHVPRALPVMPLIRLFPRRAPERTRRMWSPAA